MINIASLRKEALDILSTFDTRFIDCDILLEFVIKKPKTFIHSHPEYILSNDEVAQFNALINQRKQHIPIAYIIQKRSFWDFEFEVSKDTLIPRPETEQLIEICLHYYKDKKNLSVLDLGTGTGIIAITLAKLNPSWSITAVDINPETLKIAQKNADRLECPIHWIASNWFDNISSQTFDIIISNPPYIKEDDPHMLQGDVAYEPRLALISGSDGLDAIRTIINKSPHYLKNCGRLFLEHGYHQAENIRELLQKASFTNIQTWKDLQNHDRITGGQFV